MSLKDIFPEYYRPEMASLADVWDDCTFFIDANILLSFYRLPAEAREDLFETLAAVRDRLWVPYHAALEYQRNKMNVIAKQNALLEDVNKAIHKSISSLESELAGFLMIDHRQVISEAKSLFSNYVTGLSDLGFSQAQVNEPDKIGDRIDQLIADRVGGAPNQATVSAVEKEGDTRFADKVPPGFGDAKKEVSFLGQGVRYQARFGDLHVWKQILEKIATDQVKSAVFLTQDSKDDWWLRVSGRTIGPHPELRAEAASVGASHFQIYALSPFLEYAKANINTSIRDKSIEQASELDNEANRRRALPKSYYPLFRIKPESMDHAMLEIVVNSVFRAVAAIVNPGEIRLHKSGEFIVVTGLDIVDPILIDKMVEAVSDLTFITEIQPIASDWHSEFRTPQKIFIYKDGSSNDVTVQQGIASLCGRHVRSFETNLTEDPQVLEFREILPLWVLADLKRELEQIQGVSAVEFDMVTRDQLATIGIIADG